MDGNKINIIVSMCNFLSEAVATRGRSYSTLGFKVAVALECLMAAFCA